MFLMITMNPNRSAQRPDSHGCARTPPTQNHTRRRIRIFPSAGNVASLIGVVLGLRLAQRCPRHLTALTAMGLPVITLLCLPWQHRPAHFALAFPIYLCLQ